MNDLINRQDAIKWLDRWKGYLDEDMILRMKIGLKRDVPSAEVGTKMSSADFISKQDAIDEIEYELEMINSALDSITLDFNARERLRQRKGEAREILNSIQQLPSTERTGKWIERHPMRYDGKFVGADTDIIPDTRIRHLYCGECDKQMPIFEKFTYCPYCGARMINAWNEKELI